MNSTFATNDINAACESKHSYYRFFVVYLFTISTPILLMILSVAFLWRSHELRSYEDIVNYQLQNNAIYGPGTSVDYFEYKLRMIEKVHPETVVLGSSRALGFQGAYFNTSFVNAGSAMRSLDEGKLFIEEMLKTHKPKQIIFTLDFWWFNKATPPYTLTYKQFNKSAITTDKLLLPYRLISEKKLTISQFLAFTLFGYSKNNLTYYNNTGIMGLISSNGNRADGSMLYSEFALGGRSDLDPHFSHAAELIKKGYGNYEHGEHVYGKRLKKLDEIIALCKKNNIKVYLVIPPLAPMVREMTLSPPFNYHYVDELRAHLKNTSVPTFDFHNAADIPATNCEFIDGYHSGDITYIKMLLKMAETTHDIASIIRLEKANKTVAEYTGQVIDRSEKQYFTSEPEKDFLLIGCHKK